MLPSVRRVIGCEPVSVPGSGESPHGLGGRSAKTTARSSPVSGPARESTAAVPRSRGFGRPLRTTHSSWWWSTPAPSPRGPHCCQPVKQRWLFSELSPARRSSCPRIDPLAVRTGVRSRTFGGRPADGSACRAEDRRVARSHQGRFDLRAMSIDVSPGQSQNRPVSVRAVSRLLRSSMNWSSLSPKRCGAAYDIDK